MQVAVLNREYVMAHGVYCISHVFNCLRPKINVEFDKIINLKTLLLFEKNTALDSLENFSSQLKIRSRKQTCGILFSTKLPKVEEQF